ncbi:MAG: hypothetical protein ABSG81_13260, partial [Acidimicrobiales bacterium]
RRDHPYIDGVGGTKIAQHLSTIQTLVDSGPPRDWVIELGTNDALGNNPNWAADFAQEVSLVQDQPCVVFVTVNPTLGPVSTGIDGAIAAAVAAHANFRSLDWGTIEFSDPAWLLSDHLHPTPTGAEELARLENTVLHTCPA